MVACSSNTPVELIKELANDNNASVRSLVAASPNAPIELLKYFAQNSTNEIRLRLSAPQSLLELLKSLQDL